MFAPSYLLLSTSSESRMYCNKEAVAYVSSFTLATAFRRRELGPLGFLPSLASSVGLFLLHERSAATFAVDLSPTDFFGVCGLLGFFSGRRKPLFLSPVSRRLQKQRVI